MVSPYITHLEQTEQCLVCVDFTACQSRGNVSAKFSNSISEANHALYTKFFFIKAVSLNEFLNNLYRN